MDPEWAKVLAATTTAAAALLGALVGAAAQAWSGRTNARLTTTSQRMLARDEAILEFRKGAIQPAIDYATGLVARLMLLRREAERRNPQQAAEIWDRIRADAETQISQLLWARTILSLSPRATSALQDFEQVTQKLVDDLSDCMVGKDLGRVSTVLGERLPAVQTKLQDVVNASLAYVFTLEQERMTTAQ